MTVIGFLSGSVMYSYIIPKLTRHIDIRRTSEDENPGGANAGAAAGKPVGAVCIALDVLKAFAPVFVSVTVLGMSGYYLVPVIVAPVLGHAFSPFFWFKGGKAVASSFGSLLGVVTISKALAVLVAVMIVVNFLIIIKPDSARVITAFCLACAAVFSTEPLFIIKIAMLIISMTVCLKHIINPNKGAFSVSVGPFGLCIDHRELKLGRK